MSVLTVMPPRMLEALLIAGVAMVLTAPDAMAAGTASTESNPADELWRAYPLEQTTTATGASSTRPSNAPARSPAPAPDRGDGTPWIALLLAACAVGLAAAAVPVVRRRLAGSRRPTNDGATAATPAAALARGTRPPEPSGGAARPAAVSPAAIPPEPDRDEATRPAPSPRQAPTGPAKAVAAAAPGPARATRPPRRAAQPARAAAPSASADASDAAARQGSGPPRRDSAARKESAPRNGARPRATARGPICQIRWLPKGRGSCFSAVTTGDDGVERTIATSLRVDWTAPTPPDDNPEAQAAIRQLSKTLRAGGWRPMRTKGTDFNEPQWYARRFRYPEPPAGDAEAFASERSAS